MVSLKEILNLDVRYPGISIKVELIAIREYLKQLDSGVDRICDNYLVKELEKYDGAAYYEYQHVYTIAENEIPRLIRIPFSISIYSLFESSVTSLLSYAKDKEGKILSLKDIAGNSLHSRFNKYMQHVLAYSFKFDEKMMQQLSRVYKIRNVAAHANGSVAEMESKARKDFEEMLTPIPGVRVDNYDLQVSSEYLVYALDVVENALRSLMGYMETRYGFGVDI